MNRGDYDKFDYLIGMEWINCRNMTRIVGSDPEKKISRLLDFTDKPGDIDDPWYHGDFDSTYVLVNKGCDALLETLRKSMKD